MSPEMRARITAKNETAPAFGEVVRDAKMAGEAIAASGRTAAAGLMVEEQAMHAVARASRLAGMQQRNLMFQLNDIGVSLAGGMNPLMVLVQQGSQIATIWGPDEGGVGRAFKETGNILVGMVTKFWPVTAAVGALVGLVAGLTYEINKTAETQVSFFDTAKAGWQLLTESIGNLLSPVWTWLVDSMRWVWNQTAPIMKQIGNDIISAFVAAYNVVTSGWENLPTFMGALGKQSWNALMDGLSGDAVTWKNPFTGEVSKLLSFDFTGFKTQLTDAEKGSWKSNVGDAFSQDWMGGGFSALSDRAQAIALETAASKAEAKSKGATKTVRDLADKGIGYLKDKTNAFAEAAQSAFSNLGTGLIEAFKKGGNVGANVLDMLLGKVGQFGESLLNSGLNGLLNMGINALMGGMGGTWGQFGGFAGYSGMFGLPSYEGGGFTGSGARAGGLDGRGGRLAVLHPNETVLDHSKGQGAGSMTFHITGSKQDAAAIAEIARREAMGVFQQMQRNPDRR